MRIAQCSFAALALISLTSCKEQEQTCNVQSVKLAGLYRSDNSDPSGASEYLRFYADGWVVSAATAASPDQAAKWLTRGPGKPYPCGCYVVSEPSGAGAQIGPTIDFTLESPTMEGKWVYHGWIGARGVELGFANRVNGETHQGRAEYGKVLEPESLVNPEQGQPQGPGQNTAGRVTVAVIGGYQLKVPDGWTRLGQAEELNFQIQFRAQQIELASKYSADRSPSPPVDVAAFRFDNDKGHFVAASFRVHPDPSLIGQLRSEVKAKMDFGVEHGYISRYLGAVTIDNANFSGFYTRAIGKAGDVQLSGGIVNKGLKDNLIQLTLLCPRDWNAKKATDTLSAILNSIASDQQ